MSEVRLTIRHGDSKGSDYYKGICLVIDNKENEKSCYRGVYSETIGEPKMIGEYPNPVDIVFQFPRQYAKRVS